MRDTAFFYATAGPTFRLPIINLLDERIGDFAPIKGTTPKTSKLV